MLENIQEILPQGIFYRRRKKTTERLSLFIYFSFATFACPVSLTWREICVAGKSVIDQRQIPFAFLKFKTVDLFLKLGKPIFFEQIRESI